MDYGTLRQRNPDYVYNDEVTYKSKAVSREIKHYSLEEMSII